MFAILLLALAANDVTPVMPTVYCEAIEINTYGQAATEQVLLLGWDNKIGEYTTRQWKVYQSGYAIKDLSIDSNGYYSLFFRGENCFVKSKLLFITFTDNDVELEQRKKYDNYEISRDRGITPLAKKSWRNRYMSIYWPEIHNPKAYQLRLTQDMNE